MKSFVRNFKKIVALSLIVSSAFLLTGCQANQNNNSNGKEAQNSMKFNFFGLGGNSVVTGADTQGTNPDSIDKFFKYSLTLSNNNVRLTEGTQLPVILQGNYYVYSSPDVSVFTAGTSISGNTATLTYKFGYSTGLSLTNTEGNIQVNLANLVPTEKGYRVIPSYVNQILTEISLNNADTIQPQKVYSYFCYPVYKESEFSLIVPSSASKTAIQQGVAKLNPNNGEIKFKISYTGQPKNSNDYLYILTIKPEGRDINLNPNGESWTSLANNNMNSCGEVTPANEGGVFPIYIKLEGEGFTLNAECSPQPTTSGDVYDYKVIKDNGLICKFEVPRDNVEKQILLKLKVAYTIVRKDTSKDLKVLRTTLQ